jgi:hypothetical protein
VPPNHDTEHQHATFEGEHAPKGQEAIESLLESSSNCKKIHKMLQMALDPTICSTYHKIHLMPIQMAKVRAKSAAMREIAVKQVSKRLQIAPWSRLRSLKTNDMLRSHLFRKEVRKVMKTTRTRESTKMRKTEQTEKSRRSK